MTPISQVRDMVLNDNLPNTISVKRKGDLALLNYKQEVQFDNLWTPIELICRGLIINQKTGEVVARPFDKIFNWGEHGRKTNSSIKIVTEKMDGSLGILYRDNGYKIATRGSFDSDQAQWATDFINRRHGKFLSVLPDSLTALFEIIYPENRVVIDYKGYEGLVLLALRDRFTGMYMPWHETYNLAKAYGIDTPAFYTEHDTLVAFDNGIEGIINQCSCIGPNQEGWVVGFEDGQRFKFKGEEYKKLHKLISGLSFRFVLENHQAGTIKQALEIIPDEFKDDVNRWVQKIEETIAYTLRDIDVNFDAAPKNTRKNYAVWCKEHTPELMQYMFLRLDGKDILPAIYKHAFKEKPDVLLEKDESSQ